MFYSQAGQDAFVNESLNSKKNGYFLEIGSNDYKMHNNTYFFEKNLNWKGLMVEYDGNFLNNYKKYRSNSIHIIQDATKVNYLGNFYDTRKSSRAIFEKHGYKLVYPDVNIAYQGKLLGPFEDWWVHPDLVNTDKFKKIFDYKCPNGCCISHSVRS